MKKNRLSYRYITTILAIITIATSCNDDFLEEKPKSFLAPENTFISTKGFETALTGLYYLLSKEYDDTKHNGEDYPAFFCAGTDLGVTAFAHGHHVLFEQYTVSSANTNTVWDRYYKVIGNANQVIGAVGNEDIVWDTPSDKNRVEAEARFFRAWAYRNLIYLYGDVPLVTELTKPFKRDFTRQPVSEILDVVIEDLAFGAANLPETTETDGKLVQAAAQHLLAEIYLYANKPALAEEQAKSVIESGNYHLMTQRFGQAKNDPGDVFYDLFLEHNVNRSSGNMEGILVIQAEYNVLGGTDAANFQRRTWGPFYSAVNGFVLCDSLGGRSIGRMRPLQWWLDSYESQDIRNSKYNLRRRYWYNDPNSPKYGQEAIITPELQQAGSLFPTTTKFNFGKTADSQSYAWMHKDYYKFRLADTYLLLAEAQMKQGKLTEAAASINVVRARANATPVAASEVDMNYIMDERARELFGEDDRRLHLNRTGTLLERVRRLNPVSSPYIHNYNILLPIPQTAIDANTGAVLEQNPGY